MCNPKRILLLEDSTDDALLTIRALGKSNSDIEIDIVNNGDDALEYLFHNDNAKAIPPDLILLDVNLPGMSGIDVLKKIRSEIKTKTIPVVILTSSRELSDIRACMENGANSFIQKPVDYVKFGEIARVVSKYWLEINETP